MLTVETAQAIIAVSAAHMVRAVRKVSIERGLDPREFTLVPFGGAGPLHAGLLLRHLGVAGVIIRSHPGPVLRGGPAVGRSPDRRLADAVDARSGHRPGRRRPVVRGPIEDPHRPADRRRRGGRCLVSIDASIDCRYLGQGYELGIPLATPSAENVRRVSDDFADLHQERYGHANRSEPVQSVTLRIAAHGKYPHQRRATSVTTTKRVDPAALIGMAEVTLPGVQSASQTPVYNRCLLEPGNEIPAPRSCTRWMPPAFFLESQQATVLAAGELIVKEDVR